MHHFQETQATFSVHMDAFQVVYSWLFKQISCFRKFYVDERLLFVSLLLDKAPYTTY